MVNGSLWDQVTYPRKFVSLPAATSKARAGHVRSFVREDLVWLRMSGLAQTRAERTAEVEAELCLSSDNAPKVALHHADALGADVEGRFDEVLIHCQFSE